ncbi:MAG: hypothetical protein PHW69_09660 [Elusimicrobiaceae bacterium]|nr:hypothetical protein [Elusimicrobiaceae bacterium]
MDFFDNGINRETADTRQRAANAADNPGESRPPIPPQPGSTGRAAALNAETPDELKARLDETERKLAAEKEKVMLANLKQSQAQVVEAQVEYSLKDIQQKVQRDRRERELDDERTELRGKLKSLEEKLVTERETWVHILKTNLQPPAPPSAQPKPEAHSPNFESTIIDRLNAMEQRWAQEQQLLRRELRERPAPAAAPAEDRLSRLEAEYRRALTEKNILVQELANLKTAVSKMTNQGSYLDQISTVVLTLRDAVSTLSLQSGATLDFARNAAQKEEEFARAKDQIKKLAAAHAESEQNVKQRDGHIETLKADKLRAVQELLKLKQSLSQIRAVNSALERELTRVEAEKQAVQRSAAEQATFIGRLKKDMADNEARYLSEVSELTRKWEEQKIEMSDLTAELGRMQARHEEKVSELNALLREQAASYQARINHLELLQKTSEEKLKLVERERRELQERCDGLAAEKRTVERERNDLELDKSRLESDKRSMEREMIRLQSEKEALSAHINKLTTHGRLLFEHKQQLDAAVAELQRKSRENMASIASLNTEVSELNRRNESLKQEMTAKQAETARQQAELTRAHKEAETSLKEMLSHETAVSAALSKKIERLENATRDFAGRLKWAITGKPPRENENDGND